MDSGQWTVVSFQSAILYFQRSMGRFQSPAHSRFDHSWQKGTLVLFPVPCSLFPAYKAFTSRLLHSYARRILLEFRCCLAETRLPIARPARRKAGKDSSDGQYLYRLALFHSYGAICSLYALGSVEFPQGRARTVAIPHVSIRCLSTHYLGLASGAAAGVSASSPASSTSTAEPGTMS